MHLINLVIKWLAASIFIALGLYLFWYGKGISQVPSVFVWALGGGAVLLGILLIAMGALVIFFWHLVWVRTIAAIIGGVVLFSLILNKYSKNKIEQSAKNIVRDLCTAQGLGTPQEYLFDNTYNADCGPYHFELGTVGGGEKNIIATYQKDSDMYNRVFVPIPTTKENARSILAKLKPAKK